MMYISNSACFKLKTSHVEFGELFFEIEMAGIPNILIYFEFRKLPAKSGYHQRTLQVRNAMF